MKIYGYIALALELIIILTTVFVECRRKMKVKKKKVPENHPSGTTTGVFYHYCGNLSHPQERESRMRELEKGTGHLNCIACNTPNVVMIEYNCTNPQHWDGWSELHCFNCGTRWGRWSGKILGFNEYEDKKLRFKKGTK